MKRIPLTQGKFALVDDADHELLNKGKWYLARHGHTFYVIGRIHMTKHKGKNTYMHRVILGLQPGDSRQCDHIDGDGLNNQRSNLRFCTKTQNRQYAKKRMIGSSRYKGVSWHSRDCKWYSSIRLNGKPKHLGCFLSEKVAGVAYNQAALKHFGKFALLNTL